jgi:PAS domain S-box-containing protein
VRLFLKILGDATSPLIFTATGDSIKQDDRAVWRTYTGQPEDVVPNWGWLAAVHPDDRERVLSMWSQAVRKKSTYNMQYRLRRADGSYHHFNVQCMPVFNSDRSLRSWATLYTDADESPVAVDENWEYRAFYSVLFAQTAVGILLTNLNGRFLRVNPHYCTIIGYSEAELLNINMWDIVHPDDLARSSTDAGDLLGGVLQGKIYRMRCRRKDGTWIWVKVTITVMRKPSGEPTGYVNLVEDITTQVHAEAEQARLLARERAARAEAVERTQQLEAIFESMTDGVFVFDRDAHIVQVNSAARSFVPAAKYTDSWQAPMAERLKGFAVRDEFGQPLPVEKAPMFRILNGETLSGEQAMDVVQKHVDGYDVRVSITGAPVHDQDGTITGGVMVLRDVTERRQIEQRIQRSFQTLLGLAEALVRVPEQVDEELPSSEAPSASSIVKRAGRKLTELIDDALDCWFVGIALVDQETMKINPIASSSVSAKRAKHIEEVASKLTIMDTLDETTITELRANEVVLCDMLQQPWSKYYDEKYSPYVLIAPMMIGEQLIGLLALQVKDKQRGYTHETIALVKTVAKLITLVVERERLQQETLEARASELALREANRRFDEFLSIASHELRTPLTTIKGNIQLALRRLQTFQRQEFENAQALKEKLERIESPLSYAEQRSSVQNRMISDLLDVSRIQANRLVLVMKPCNLVDIVRSSVRDERHAAPNREITLEILTDKHVPIIADADRISQVIHNYLSNALKYSPAHQPVNVRIEREGAMARVSVSDKGPGLSPQEQQRVWERFYRVKGIEVQSGSGIGLGLGLHICRMIVEYHNGQYGLESAVGTGSTFWFSLPVVQEAEATVVPETVSSIAV